MAAPGSNFPYFKDQIAALSPSPDKSELLGGEFLLHEGVVDVHYAPFDGTNPEARVVLVGITPGWTQMQQAFETARAALVRGDDDDEVLRRVKGEASFKGMRSTLVRYLDGIGLPGALGVGSTEALFSTHRHLLHTTSILRYPVFVDGENYTGSKPRMADVEFLREQIEGMFAPEMDAIPAALIVPLGRAVDESVASLVRAGHIDTVRILTGFPHPSGANAGGPAQFERNRDDMANQVAHWNGGPAPVRQPAPTTPPPIAPVRDPRPKRRTGASNGLVKSMYWMPGGKDSYLRVTERILSHLGAPTGDPCTWVAAEFGCSPATADSALGFLRKAGLVGTDQGAQFLSTADPNVVMDAFADHFVFVAEVVELCESGASADEIRREANATGLVNWKTDVQAKIRLDWLTACGMLVESSGAFVTTAEGRAWLASR